MRQPLKTAPSRACQIAKAAMVAATIASFSGGFGNGALAQYAVHDAPNTSVNTTNGIKIDATNFALFEANRKLDAANKLLATIASMSVETAANTSGSLDHLGRLSQSMGDPRVKASRREVRQKWMIGGQGFANVANAGDAVRPVGASWALRMNQPRGDGSDVRPSIDVLADPGMASNYSRQAFSTVATRDDQVTRSQIELRRKAEQSSALHDAHGMSLHSIMTTSTTFKRVDRLMTIADEAYEAGLSDQIFALNMSIAALLEEQASTRALLAQFVRANVASALASQPAVGARNIDLGRNNGTDGLPWEYGIGDATSTSAGGSSTSPLGGRPGQNSGGQNSGGQNTGGLDAGSGTAARRTWSYVGTGIVPGSGAGSGAGVSGSWNPRTYLEALEFSTTSGDFMSSIGGMAGFGCPYSMMGGARSSGCSRAVMGLLLGQTGLGYGAQRSILSVVSGGGLSASSLGVSAPTLSVSGVANMFGVGGLTTCFGGGGGNCSYACAKFTQERMTGGRCSASAVGGGFGGADLASDILSGFDGGARMRQPNFGYCKQLEASCQSESMPFGLSMSRIRDSLLEAGDAIDGFFDSESETGLSGESPSWTDPDAP
jgi:hypothetical protein